jgi:hypothetical protein
VKNDLNIVHPSNINENGTKRADRDEGGKEPRSPFWTSSSYDTKNAYVVEF